MLIQKAVDSLFGKLERLTQSYMNGLGGWINNLILILSPITFLPTLYSAITVPNIDAMKNITWPLLILTNISACLALAQKGTWIMRLVQIIWVLIFVTMTIVVLIR